MSWSESLVKESIKDGYDLVIDNKKIKGYVCVSDVFEGGGGSESNLLAHETDLSGKTFIFGGITWTIHQVEYDYGKGGLIYIISSPEEDNAIKEREQYLTKDNHE